MHTRIFTRYDKRNDLHFLYLNETAVIEKNGRLLVIANIYDRSGRSLDFDLIITSQFSDTLPVSKLAQKMKYFLCKAYKWTQDDARRKKYTLHVVDGNLPEVKLDFF